MIETVQTINGKEYQTKIITHTGYRRVVKFRHSNQEKIKDEVRLFKNHSKECGCRG